MAQPSMLYKLIVMYMLENSEEPLSNSQISDFMLEKEYTNYFQLQQTFSDLTEAGLITAETVRNATYYRLSKEGVTTLSYFDQEISPGIKKDVRVFLKERNMQTKNSVIAAADYYENDHGSYPVRCQILEKGSSRLDVTLVMPSEEAAKAVAENWKKKSQDIYAYLMEELM